MNRTLESQPLPSSSSIGTGVADIRNILGPHGALAARVPGFKARLEQQAMAETILQAIEERRHVICEAGTGTGKTLAYLVPALLSGQKVIVSTGTRTLQDQLQQKDLPLVREALGIAVQARLLKGRANYLCLQRLGVNEADGRFRDRRLPGALARVREWAASTRHGDIAELAEFAEDAPVWRYATSTRENCLGQECPAVADCHVLAARRRAQNADLLIINHHLFFADMVLREEGAEFLPQADAIIVDEAHQLPELAARFFGRSLSSHQLVDFARDAGSAARAEASDVAEIPDRIAALERALAALAVSFGTKSDRIDWTTLASAREVRDALDRFSVALATLGEALSQTAERGKALSASDRRCRVLERRLRALVRESSGDSVRWLERRRASFTWHESPLDVSEQFEAWLETQDCALILVSATLSVRDSMAHFAKRLGLTDVQSHIWTSPFDYAGRTLLYVPQGMPEPNRPDYGQAFCDAIAPVLEASQGCAFVLFTSHNALAVAAEALRQRIVFPLLIQGEHARGELLRKFTALPNAVLLGTYSFWEGVDVRGDALRCVIIDKLPFAPHTDPLNKARNAYLRAKGEDAFLTHQLPQAVIALKQGVGRLMRDERDYGVVVLCDPRVATRGYGRAFIKSLPAMPLTRSLDEVAAFFASQAPGTEL